jgi:hypothetical protein
MNFEPKTEGIFHGLSEGAYRCAPGVNISSLKAMGKSPAHYLAAIKTRKEPTPAMVFGSLLHLAALEPQRLSGSFVVRPAGMTFQTKEGKEWKAKQRVPIITEEEHGALLSCRDSVLSHPAAQQILAAADKEVSVFKRHRRTGLLLKGRLDAVANATDGETWVADVKTCEDAGEGGFCRSIAAFGYAQQAAYYLDLLGASHFVFIAVEKAAPWACAVYELDRDSIEKGRAQNEANLDRLEECLSTEKWPAYSGEIQTISLPRWANY